MASPSENIKLLPGLTPTPLGFGAGQQGQQFLGNQGPITNAASTQNIATAFAPNTLADLVRATQQFGQQAKQTSGQFQTGFNQFVPQLQTQFQPIQGLQTQFQAPQFSQKLDPLSQQLLSQAQQTQRVQLGTQQQQLGQQFRGNQGLLNVLANQAQQRAALAMNPLPFEAMLQQQARETQNYQLGQQAQSLSNQALLQQGGYNMAAQQAGNQALLSQQGAQNLGGSLGNQALAQQLGIQGAGVDAQTNLAGLLGTLFQMFNPDFKG